MSYQKATSYEPDMASLIDTEEEIIADRYGVSIQTAKRIIEDRRDSIIHHQVDLLSGIIAQLLSSNNIVAKVYSLGIAFGFDHLAGFHSQSEVAKKLGCTRALISHYVVGWRDLFDSGIAPFDCTKFRKHNEVREVYAEKTINPVIQFKNEIRNKLKSSKS